MLRQGGVSSIRPRPPEHFLRHLHHRRIPAAHAVQFHVTVIAQHHGEGHRLAIPPPHPKPQCIAIHTRAHQHVHLISRHARFAIVVDNNVQHQRSAYGPRIIGQRQGRAGLTVQERPPHSNPWRIMTCHIPRRHRARQSKYRTPHDHYLLYVPGRPLRAVQLPYARTITCESSCWVTSRIVPRFPLSVLSRNARIYVSIRFRLYKACAALALSFAPSKRSSLKLPCTSPLAFSTTSNDPAGHCSSCSSFFLK